MYVSAPGDPSPPSTSNFIPEFPRSACASIASQIPPLPLRGRVLVASSPLAMIAIFENAFSKNAFFKNFANFWRARSRLYQNEILQENMRSTAFFKLYKICILLHRCNLKIFAKNRFEKSAIFVKIQQKFCKCRKICKILPNFKNFSLKIW